MVAQYTGVTAATDEQDAEENEILYLCTFEGCGKGFADAGSLRKHAHTHGEKQFICHYDGCGKVREAFILAIERLLLIRISSLTCYSCMIAAFR